MTGFTVFVCFTRRSGGLLRQVLLYFTGRTEVRDKVTAGTSQPTSNGS